MKLALAQLRKVAELVTPDRVAAMRATLRSGIEITEVIAEYLDAFDQRVSFQLIAATTSDHDDHMAAVQAEEHEQAVLSRIRELARPQVAAYRASTAQAASHGYNMKDLLT